MKAALQKVISLAKPHKANAIQLAGLATVSASAFAVALPLGLLVAGLFICLVGWKAN